MESAAFIFIFGFISIFTALIGFLLCLILIYYEKNLNDRYRTLVNELYTLVIVYVMLCIGSISVVIIMRLFMESLHEIVCLGLNTITISSVFALCFALNEATLVQFLYICHFKTVGILDEWLIFRILNILNLAISSYVGIFIQYGHMNLPRGVAYCTNQDPDDVFQPRVYNFSFPYFSYMIVLTLIWHLILRYKIRRYKLYSPSSKGGPNQVVEELVSYWSVLIFLLFFCVSSLAPPVEEKDRPPMIFTAIVVNVALGWTMPGYSIWKNKKIRIFIKANLFNNNVEPNIIIV